MKRGTKVGDVLAMLGGVAAFLTGLGYWQIAAPALAVLLAYGYLRIHFLRLP